MDLFDPFGILLVLFVTNKLINGSILFLTFLLCVLNKDRSNRGIKENRG